MRSAPQGCERQPAAPPVSLNQAGRLLGNCAARAGAALQRLYPGPAWPQRGGQRRTEDCAPPVVAGFMEEVTGPTGPHPCLQVHLRAGKLGFPGLAPLLPGRPSPTSTPLWASSHFKGPRPGSRERLEGKGTGRGSRDVEGVGSDLARCPLPVCASQRVGTGEMDGVTCCEGQAAP